VNPVGVHVSIPTLRADCVCQIASSAALGSSKLTYRLRYLPLILYVFSDCSQSFMFLNLNLLSSVDDLFIRSLLADAIHPLDTRELCSLLVVVSEAAKFLAGMDLYR
jgi:hypothetical protein